MGTWEHFQAHKSIIFPLLPKHTHNNTQSARNTHIAWENMCHLNIHHGFNWLFLDRWDCLNGSRWLGAQENRRCEGHFWRWRSSGLFSSCHHCARRARVHHCLFRLLWSDSRVTWVYKRKLFLMVLQWDINQDEFSYFQNVCWISTPCVSLSSSCCKFCSPFSCLSTIKMFRMLQTAVGIVSGRDGHLIIEIQLISESSMRFRPTSNAAEVYHHLTMDHKLFLPRAVKEMQSIATQSLHTRRAAEHKFNTTSKTRLSGLHTCRSRWPSLKWVKVSSTLSVSILKNLLTFQLVGVIFGCCLSSNIRNNSR